MPFAAPENEASANHMGIAKQRRNAFRFCGAQGEVIPPNNQIFEIEPESRSSCPVGRYRASESTQRECAAKTLLPAPRKYLDSRRLRRRKALESFMSKCTVQVSVLIFITGRLIALLPTHVLVVEE